MQAFVSERSEESQLLLSGFSMDAITALKPIGSTARIEMDFYSLRKNALWNDYSNNRCSQMR